MQETANGTNTLYTYDTASRLTGVNGIGYVLDANGNRIQMSDWEGVTSYSYDALDRLAQAAYPTSTVTYTLDSVGNRLSDGGNTFGYDASDRILNPGYAYDANGNLLADGTATYEYDAANRLIQMTRSGVVTTYGYDGWGNLIQESTNGVTTEFVLDENAAYPRILGEVRSDGGERLYAYGPEGFSAQLAVGGTVEYPLLDGLGSVRQLTDAAGTVILTRSYDAFGNVRYAAGAGVTRLGYTGEMQDSVSGLVYLRARHYHPVLGRFLQRDSFGGSGQRPQSLNRYSYTENNPVNLVDPSGHIAVCFQGSPKYTVGEGSSSIRFCREALREGGYREGGGENDHGPILGYAAVGIGYWEAYRSVFDAHAERPEEPVIIFGYSWGAVTAMNLAWELYGHSDTPNTCPLNPVPIDLLMLFEFEDFGRLAIHETPPNVKSAVNFYAPWADSQPNPTADGVNEIRGATNIPVRRTPDGDDADHFSIINLQAGDRHESDIYTPPEKRHPPEPPVPDAEAELNDNTINRAADYVRQVMMRH